jgi:hypothetical protein
MEKFLIYAVLNSMRLIVCNYLALQLCTIQYSVQGMHSLSFCGSFCQQFFCGLPWLYDNQIDTQKCLHAIYECFNTIPACINMLLPGCLRLFSIGKDSTSFLCGLEGVSSIKSSDKHSSHIYYEESSLCSEQYVHVTNSVRGLETWHSVSIMWQVAWCCKFCCFLAPIRCTHD